MDPLLIFHTNEILTQLLREGTGNGNPTVVLLPGKFHRQRSLVSYSLWGFKEVDTTERLHKPE